MKLRTFATTAALALALTGLFTGGALVITTDYLKDAARGIGESVESVYAAEELNRQLLRHNRSALLYGVTSQRLYHAERRDAGQRILRLLAQVHDHISTPAEARVVERVEAAVRAYMEARRTIGAEQNPLDTYVTVRVPLEVAQNTIDELIQLNRAQAHALMATVARQDRFADGLGSAVIVVFLLVVGSLVLLGWRLVFLPMLALSDTIDKFAAGRLQSRAGVAGVDELARMSQAFNAMADGLSRQKANQLQVMACIAHDLRNPLGAIRMASELLRPDSGLPEAKQVRIADTIRRQAFELERLVTDLLDSTRIEAGELGIDAHSNDLCTLVREVATLFQTMSAEHPLDVRLPDAPVWCRFDPQRMGQVMNNLLSNAIKYSPHGGIVDISAYRDDDCAVVAVADRGIGVSEAERSKIFEPFQRSDATRATIPGVGLGLSVSRKIVEGHGGRILVETRPGGGTIFKISLPLDTVHLN